MLGCFAITALLGPMAAATLKCDMNRFAIACILLSICIYLLFLLHFIPINALSMKLARPIPRLFRR